MAFHITGYISDGHRFSFVGTLPSPFRKFVINNSIIPIVFLVVYIYQVIVFQIHNEHCSTGELISRIGGFLVGYVFMTFLFSLYFKFTNKDIFRYMVCRIDEKIKDNVKVARASAMKKLDIARKKQVRVDRYISSNLSIKPVEDINFFDRATVLQVFDQNHFNLVIIELFIFFMVTILGIFKDYPAFQLPAAASFMTFLTIFVMLFGAFSYWFGGWSSTVGLIVFLVINFLVGDDFFSKKYQAFGMDYSMMASPYNSAVIQQQIDSASIEQDRAATLVQLENWKNKLFLKIRFKY